MSDQRYDIYRLVHKGLREFMSQVLDTVSRMDPDDDIERAAALAQVRELLAFCHSHLKKEDAFVHPAMEERSPGSCSQTSGDHDHHRDSFLELETAIKTVELSDGEARAPSAHALYRALALFVGENFSHMHLEETANNEVLWRTHSDAELMAIEHAIVASLSPQDKAFSMRWMLPAANPAERAELLNAMRSGMPPAAFLGLLASVRPLLSEANWRKLSSALELPRLAA